MYNVELSWWFFNINRLCYDDGSDDCCVVDQDGDEIFDNDSNDNYDNYGDNCEVFGGVNFHLGTNEWAWSPFGYSLLLLNLSIRVLKISKKILCPTSLSISVCLIQRSFIVLDLPHFKATFGQSTARWK